MPLSSRVGHGALWMGPWQRRLESVGVSVCVCPVSPGPVCASAAERVTSLGKDWHRPCLKCEKCGKTLTSGGHAEVGGAWWWHRGG